MNWQVDWQFAAASLGTLILAIVVLRWESLRRKKRMRDDAARFGGMWRAEPATTAPDKSADGNSVKRAA